MKEFLIKSFSISKYMMDEVRKGIASFYDYQGVLIFPLEYGESKAQIIALTIEKEAYLKLLEGYEVNAKTYTYDAYELAKLLELKWLKRISNTDMNLLEVLSQDVTLNDLEL